MTLPAWMLAEIKDSQLTIAIIDQTENETNPLFPISITDIEVNNLQ